METLLHAYPQALHSRKLGLDLYPKILARIGGGGSGSSSNNEDDMDDLDMKSRGGGVGGGILHNLCLLAPPPIRAKILGYKSKPNFRECNACGYACNKVSIPSSHVR